MNSNEIEIPKLCIVGDSNVGKTCIIQGTLIFTNNSRRNSLSKVVSSALGRVGNKQRYDATWWRVLELQNKNIEIRILSCNFTFEK